MSDIKETLQHLVRYYDTNRGVGHTSAVINGAQNTNGCVVVTAYRGDALQYAAQDTFTMMTLKDLRDDKLLGRRSPLVFDNHAITELVRQSLAEIARLEKTIETMKTAAQIIANVNIHD